MIDTDARKPITKKDLRTFATGLLVICAVLGGVFFWRDKQTAALVFGVLALWALIALPLPLLIRPIHAVFSVLGLALGWVNTRLILGLVYYLIFGPIGLFFRLTGRDPLARRIDKSKDSYWVELPEQAFDEEWFRRQY